MWKKKNTEVDPKMFDDIRELCVCCAKAVVAISTKYNENPRLVNKLFIEVYTKISDEVEKST